MGAWLLGATMNAVMTWWAVSLTLLNHQLGNEILDREQLLRIVPIFVALLVWLTRILFIGSLTVAGETMFDFHGEEAENQLQVRPQPAVKPQALPVASTTQPVTARPNNTRPAAPPPQPANRPRVTTPAASFSAPSEVTSSAPQLTQPTRPNVAVPPPPPATGTVDNRNRRRPPVPNNRPAGMPLGMQASDRNKFS